jgi:DNA-binding PadR family transcriptional regulator
MRGSRMRYMHDHRGHGHGPSRHRARRGAIKGSVLRLLAERPMHGYELITEFEDRSSGRWRPSPGSVYPLLAQLEDEGLVRAVDDGGRKRFELTDDGKAWLDEHGEDSGLPWERWSPGGRGDLRRLGGEIFGQLRQLGRFGSAKQLDRAGEILMRTRQELYELLAQPPADEEEEETDE